MLAFWYARALRARGFARRQLDTDANKSAAVSETGPATENDAAPQGADPEKTAKQVARHQTDLFSAILDGMAEGVLVCALDGSLLLCNQAAHLILPGPSFDPQSNIATFLDGYEIFSDEFETPALLADIPLSRALRGIQVDNAELHLRLRSTGESVRLEISGRPLPDPNGKLYAAMVVFRDTTGRTDAEHECARLAALVRSSRDAIISGTTGGLIATFNPGAERLYGYTHDEAIGHPFAMLEPPDRSGETGRMMRESLSRRDGVRYETRRLRKDGSVFDAEVIDSIIYDEDGRSIGFSAIVRDITEAKRSARELAERTRELERSNLELGQFAYSASHDLQEPLRMIGSYVQLLRDRYRGRLDADADDFIDFAVDGAMRMKQLINDLLLYSRAGRGNSRAVVESDAALDWAVANLALKISESGAVVVRGEMPPVMAEGSQLGQLFQNLIDNALKFRTAETPRIEIGAERRDEMWEFCVHDNGIGIEQKYATRIFQMFQRLHSITEYPGSGIGLAVCRKIAERNGGRIWVDAEARTGTAFRFTIPAVAAEGARNAHHL